LYLDTTRLSTPRTPRVTPRNPFNHQYQNDEKFDKIISKNKKELEKEKISNLDTVEFYDPSDSNDFDELSFIKRQVT